MDIIQILLSLVNLKAALIGVAATQAYCYFVPSPADGVFATTGGGWRARLVPLVAPLFAVAACVILEWDGKYSPDDVVRGILSGFASEVMLRFYYKSIRGL